MDLVVKPTVSSTMLDLTDPVITDFRLVALADDVVGR